MHKLPAAAWSPRAKDGSTPPSGSFIFEKVRSKKVNGIWSLPAFQILMSFLGPQIYDVRGFASKKNVFFLLLFWTAYCVQVTFSRPIHFDVPCFRVFLCCKHVPPRTQGTCSQQAWGTCQSLLIHKNVEVVCEIGWSLLIPSCQGKIDILYIPHTSMVLTKFPPYRISM